MYDPQSGQILCDGQPIQSYRLSDLRQATATLTQDHHLFPVSLAENIGLGNTEYVGDKAMIAKAAVLGGADACMAKLVDGVDTILNPPFVAYGSNLIDDASLHAFICCISDCGVARGSVTKGTAEASQENRAIWRRKATYSSVSRCPFQIPCSHI